MYRFEGDSMKKSIIILFTLTMTLVADIVVIANKNVPNIDARTIGKVFTGKIMSMNSITLIPVHLNNDSVKTRFLQKFVGMNEEEYIAYWTVRQYIGKGVSPKEFSTTSAVILYVKQTPGAIGYVHDTDLVEGISIIDRR